MSNQSIHKRIEELKKQFNRTDFTKHEENMQIAEEILSLQQQCTHLLPNNQFAYSEINGNICLYCGKHIRG